MANGLNFLDRVRRAAANFLMPGRPGGEGSGGSQRIIHPGNPERHHAYPLTGLTPAKLRGYFRSADADGDLSTLAELWEEIEQADGRIGGVLMTRKLAMTGLELQIKPPEGSENDPRAADAVKLCQRQWSHLCDGLAVDDGSKDSEHPLIEMGGALLAGWSVHQLVWERDGLGEMRIARLNKVSGRRLRIDKQGRPKVVVGDSANEQATIAERPDEFMVHIYRAAGGIPSRYGLGRTVALTFVLKNYAIKDWSVLSEVFGMPLRVGRYEPGASADEKAELLQMLGSLGSDTYAIFSRAVEVEFVEAVKSGAAGSPQPVIIDAMDNLHTIAILGQTLTTDVGDTGSYAAANVHDRVRGDLLESDATASARTIRRDIFAPLVRFNIGRDAPVPEAEFAIPEAIDLTGLAQQMSQLAAAGLLYEQDRQWVREKWGMPEVKPGAPLLTPAALQGAGTGFGPTPAPIELPPVRRAPALPAPKTAAELPGKAQEVQVSEDFIPTGVQITAAVDIVARVVKGEIPRDAALGLLQTMFNLGREQAARILGSAVERRDKVIANAAAPVSDATRHEAAWSAAAAAVANAMTPRATQRELDRLARQAAVEAAPALASLAAPLRAAIANATDFDDLRRRIAAATAQMDPTQAADVWERVLYAADVLGRSDGLAGIGGPEAG